MPKLIGDSRLVCRASCERVGAVASVPVAAIGGSTASQVTCTTSRLCQRGGS
jgi:hypothetical protein